MARMGVLADSRGNIEAFDRALRLLLGMGAKRFLFAGGNYSDLDEWVKMRRDQAKAQTDYSGLDFLDDVRGFLGEADPVARPAAFGTAFELSRVAEDLLKLKDRVLRTPERGSISYNNPSIAKKAVDMVGETLVCLVHHKDDLTKEDLLNAAVLVHGNELAPAVVHIGPRYFVCPGALGGTSTPSVGMFETGEGGLQFSAHGLDGQLVLAPQVLASGAKTKLTVK